MARFKPTLQQEMDLMKFLLQDFATLKKCMLEDIVVEFWKTEQNRALYAQMKEEFTKNKNVEPKHFYQNTLRLAEKTIPNFNFSFYEDHFELNFNFTSTFLDYYQYFKCKGIAVIFRKLAEQFESNDFKYAEVLAEIEKAKKELGSTLRRKI